jgi:hypothetical protein
VSVRSQALGLTFAPLLFSAVRPEELELDTCDIDQVPVSEFTMEFFEANYRGRRPVVVVGLSSGPEWLASHEQRWSRAKLQEVYGNK